MTELISAVEAAYLMVVALAGAVAKLARDRHLQQIELRKLEQSETTVGEDVQDRVVQRLERVIEQLSNRVDVLHDRVETLERRLADREAELARLRTELVARETRIAELEREIAVLRGEIDTIGETA